MVSKERLHSLRDNINVIWNSLNRKEISATEAIFVLTRIISGIVSYLEEELEG